MESGGRERGASRLVGDVEADAARQVPEGDVLGQDHVRVAQHEHHVALRSRVTHDADLVRHDAAAVVRLRHLRRRGRCGATHMHPFDEPIIVTRCIS